MMTDMETIRRKNSIFAWALLPTVFSLAWPTMLEQLMQTAVQYIDTAMVGSLGTAATAAVGSTLTVNWLIGSTVSAFGVGFLAQISQAFGAGDEGRARRAAAQSVLAVLVLGVLFTALTLSLSPYVPVWMQVEPSLRSTAARYFFVLYLPMLPRTAMILFGTVLRAAGDTKTPMRVGVGVNLVNVVLNFLLVYPVRSVILFGRSVTIWGADWGVTGAALGSTVLRMVALSEPFYGVSVVIEGMLQGAGKTKAPFVFNILGMWGVRIVGTFVCTGLLGMGLVSAWGCMIGHNMLLFALFLGYYLSGRWLRTGRRGERI